MTRRRTPPTEVSSEMTGSPKSGEPEYIVVGKIRRPHGIYGELVLELMTDFPERLFPGKRVFIGEKHEPYLIEHMRQHNEGALIAFQGLTVREEAARITNSLMYVSARGLPELPKGEYYYHELFGLSVQNEAGDEIGKLTEVLETGANDVYVVISEDGEETLIPALENVVLEIDLQNGRIVVRPPEWG
jgi:16S rRNA processing protein RimM